MKQLYIEKDFKPATVSLIDKINIIVREYQQQGFILTVRQLYYQLVARAIIPNTLQEYKRVAGIINDAKLAGLIDWDAIEDRTRSFIRRTRWQDGPHILRAAVSNYHQDMWKNQDSRVFVIVEKEALVGVLENVCSQYDVPLLAARGYPSGSVLREFAITDLQETLQQEQSIAVLHLGDHDPSGIDMTRDLQSRLSMFTEDHVYVHRLALNMDQVTALNPPKNPAKITDSRFDDYAAQFGHSSWELDALTPTYLANLVESNIQAFIDQNRWNATVQETEEVKTKIQTVADGWDNA